MAQRERRLDSSRGSPTPPGRAASVKAPLALALSVSLPPAVVSGLVLVVPSANTFVTSHLALVLLLLACLAGTVGFIAFRRRGAGRDVAALSSGLQALCQDLADGVDVSGNQLPCPAELAPIVEVIDAALSRVQERHREAFDLLASNRVLARELNRLFQLLDSTADGILTVDGAGNVIFANMASAPFLTIAPHEARGKPAHECIGERRVLELLTGQADEDARHGVRSIELPPDEESRRGHVMVLHSHGDGERDSLGQVLVFRDISRLKNVERLQADFVDSVAHELRTPLTSIRAYVEMLIDDEAADVEMKRSFYNVIYEETDRLSLLIDNLLNISMMESGAAKLDATPTRVKKLLEDCLDVVRPQCDGKSVALIADLPDRLPTLDVDKNLFGVAVMNILGNAVKYTPEEGRITLSTESLEEEFRIAITDTGVGMSPEDLPRIFDKFFRCSSAGEVQGSGVGLSTARQIVRLHGGDIHVTSKLGEGTRFSIVLPRTLIDSTIGE